jgi:ADP-heptose:LPS heptosyltransferase
MRIVRADVPMRCANGLAIPPDTRVVVPDEAARQMEAGGFPGLRVSGIGCYTRHYCGQDLTGKRLIAVRGDGIGDQLVVSGILAMLKRRYPTSRIAFPVDPRLWEAWGKGEPDAPWRGLFDIVPPAMHLETMWLAADYHLLFVDMVESCREPDQPGIWEAHCLAAGIGLRAEAEMRPVSIATAKARNAVARWLHMAGIDPARKLVVWQLAASSPVRSMGPVPTRAALAALVAALPDCAVVATCAPWETATYQAALPPGVALCDSPRFYPKVGLVERAALLVAPDSSLGHVAAGLARPTPTVSLWCSFRPEDRVSHYPNHRPIEGQCPYGRGPCRRHEATSPARGCPETDCGDTCAGLDGIGPERIVEAARDALANA